MKAWYASIGGALSCLAACACTAQGSNGQAGPQTAGAVGSSPEAGTSPDADPVDTRARVILDTDANNELDDQHAIAYLLFNSDVFDIEGLTVNRTVNGGSIDDHVAEAERVVRMCAAEGIPVLKGADGDFDAISGHVAEATFDGHEAVDFIIERANVADERRLLLVPIGKLTNIALALHKAPSIADRVRVVWLGSHWPNPGEYNLDNDTESVNSVIDSGVELHIALVRYGANSGTDAVRVTTAEIESTMPALGPQVNPPVPGRTGSSFSNFGDYSVELFRASGSASRALFDVAAVAVVKNAGWAQALEVPAPMLVGNAWQERSDNPHRVVFYENFDRDAIIADFYDTMQNYALP